MKNNPWIMPFTNRRYLDTVEKRGVLFDGAMGTQLAKYPLTADDFGGLRTEGLMEMLLFHRPELVVQVHSAYLEAGAEAIKTNTFRANPLTLAEFGVRGRAREIGRIAAALARQAAARVQAETGIPRFVAGSMGPSGKLPSLDDAAFAAEDSVENSALLPNVTFGELVTVYAEYARGLVEGGVDLLLIETQQDLLELKAVIHGIWRVFRELELRVPIQAQVTLEASGRMLSGPDIETALAAVAALPVDVIGMNCSTGPHEMRESVRRLLAMTRHPVSVMPNAGMPENVEGQAVYRMAPASFTEAMLEFVGWGVRVVGGCCGTGPEHIAHLRAALADGVGQNRESRMMNDASEYGRYVVPSPLPFVASNIHAVALHQEPRPLIVGERINTQGSRQARQWVLEERYDALLDLAETQVVYGAHVLDVCVALTERANEAATMQRVVKLLSLNSPAPLMIDTTALDVMRAALKTCPGRAILNSVNLEAGEDHARDVLTLARDFGAALVALTIDEQGMAKTADRKLDVARRLYRLAVDAVGLPPHALIFDPLTFTLATGDAETAHAAVETLDAIRRIKADLPGVLTNLGVSNVSYGLKAAARRVLNSVFLYRAVEAGLDMAIVNPAQVTPYPEIPTEARALADDLIFDRHPEALARYIAYFADVTVTAVVEMPADLPPDKRLFSAILHRHREGVEALVDACLALKSPLDILNDILFPAMKEVGDQFGAGTLILPFVLKSAEVMKVAVAYLEQFFERTERVSKGTIVLATVFGDVHDIGKNLVKTILVNNGYTVHDLGKQVPVSVIIDKAVEVQADAIGLSALLVATSQQMQRAVEELHRRGLSIPLLVGGAAVNERFAQRIAIVKDGDLYMGGVYHCKDAFEALQVLEHVIMHKPDLHAHSHGYEEMPSQGGERAVSVAACGDSCAGCASAPAPARTLSQTPCLDGLPTPPFWGASHGARIPLAEIRPLLDRKSLFRVGWGARGATGEAWSKLEAEFEARLEEMWPALPLSASGQTKAGLAGGYLEPQAVYGYFPVQSQGNSVLIYDPAEPEARREVAHFSFPRQAGGARLCLADYFAPVEGALLDVIALQVVTVGGGATARFGALDAAGAYSEAYFVHGLAAQAAEATAEWMHRHIRRELGLADERGKRYSWGYPACPDVTAHRVVFKLLSVAEALGMALSPAAQLIPEHSTAALIVHHPAAKYFIVK